MRLIDADALKEQVCLDGDCTQCKTGVNEKMCKWDMVQLNDVVERIESAPTIDVEPVVLRKDCEKDYTEKCPFKVAKFGYTGLDFCPDGERKYNETD